MPSDPSDDHVDPEDVASSFTSRNTRAGSQLPRRRAVTADPEDVVGTPLDKIATGMPAEDRRGRAARRDARGGNERTSAGPRRPALWTSVETMHSPAPVYGAFPQRFVPWALRMLGCESRAAEVLHVCSGALTREEVFGGMRVDLRAEARPDVIADGRALPFAEASWRGVLLDPPYSPEYARDLYGTDYPRPSHLLREAARVCRPGGRIGILHFLVPSPPKGCSIALVRGVTQGVGYRIRAFTVYERIEQGELALGGCA